MSDYGRIRPAISHYEGLARSSTGADFVKATAAQFADLQAKYYSVTENPDYSSDLKKFCYLYKYSVAHGYYIYSVLKRLKPKLNPDLFSRPLTRVACIGGGPGSEIIGIARYIREMEPDNVGKNVEIVIFDKEPTWEDACNIVLECVGPGLNIAIKFVQFDATSPETYDGIDFSIFDHVMTNFFTSEIRKLKIATVSRQFWKYLFSSMGDGRVFIAVDFADNDGRAWAYINSIIPNSAIDVLSDSSLAMGCPDSKASILALEQEIDHRPKKNATNLVRAVITG